MKLLTGSVLLLYLMVALVAQTYAEALDKKITTVPFGDKIDGRIFNYNRTAPDIATAGLIKEGGVDLLTAEGFRAVIDLRTLPEGTAEEQAAMEIAGIEYTNIPIGKEAPSTEDVGRFASIVGDPGRGPLLVHCVSANRVGTLWAMYRVSTGVPLQTALEEGRTVGMKPARESNVVEYAATISPTSSQVQTATD
jgi:uncharacterized protein (TIGR01244 family)